MQALTIDAENPDSIAKSHITIRLNIILIFFMLSDSVRFKKNLLEENERTVLSSAKEKIISNLHSRTLSLSELNSAVRKIDDMNIENPLNRRIFIAFSPRNLSSGVSHTGFSEELERIFLSETGTFYSRKGLFVFDTLSVNEEAFRIVSHIPQQNLDISLYGKNRIPLWIRIALGVTALFFGVLAVSFALERRRAMDELKTSAVIDPLTNVFNQPAFWEIFQKHLHQAQRYKRKFAMVLIEIAQIKKIERNLGAEISQAIIKHLSAMIKDNLRKSDIMSRWEQNEFIVLLPETNLDSAVRVFQKVKGIIDKTEFSIGEVVLNLSINFEIYVFPKKKK